MRDAEAAAGLNGVELTYRILLSASTDVAPKLFSRHGWAAKPSAQP